jgi:hypothetical protein
VAAPLGADDEIAGRAFALVVEQRAFENECLFQILVHVRRNAGAGIELCEDRQHASCRIVINHLHLAARRRRDPRQRFGVDKMGGQRAQR